MSASKKQAAPGVVGQLTNIERRLDALQWALAALLERVRRDETPPFEFEIKELREAPR